MTSTAAPEIAVDAMIDELERLRQRRATEAQNRAWSHIVKAGEARDRGDWLEQSHHGRAATDAVLTDDDDVSTVIRALGFEHEVGGLLTGNRLERARRRSDEGPKLLGGGRFFRADRARLIVERTRIEVLELTGRPDLALSKVLERIHELSDAAACFDIELLLHYDHMISATLRCPPGVSGREQYLAWARKRGGAVANRLADQHPAVVAHFWHWLAIAEAVAPSKSPGKSRDEIVSLLTRSIEGRRQTPFHDIGKAMAIAERELAGGDRGQAIELFDATLHEMRHTLPRQHHSARVRLAQRRLLAA